MPYVDIIGILNGCQADWGFVPPGMNILAGEYSAAPLEVSTPPQVNTLPLSLFLDKILIVALSGLELTAIFLPQPPLPFVEIMGMSTQARVTVFFIFSTLSLIK